MLAKDWLDLLQGELVQLDDFGLRPKGGRSTSGLGLPILTPSDVRGIMDISTMLTSVESAELPRQ